MRCAICRRPLLCSAVPGMQIGPKCAKDKGLMPKQERRRAAVAALRMRKRPDSAQVDWIKELKPGEAGESATA